MHPKPATPPSDRDGRRKTLSWALYDWANSAFAITVMSAFFPLFLRTGFKMKFEIAVADASK